VHELFTTLQIVSFHESWFLRFPFGRVFVNRRFIQIDILVQMRLDSFYSATLVNSRNSGDNFLRCFLVPLEKYHSVSPNTGESPFSQTVHVFPDVQHFWMQRKQGSHKNWESTIPRPQKWQEDCWKQRVECTGWTFWCLTQIFLNFFTLQASAEKKFGTNLRFHDFSMTLTNISNFHDFSRPTMKISNSMTFHDRVNSGIVQAIPIP